jgi:hypothetical protein
MKLKFIRYLEMLVVFNWVALIIDFFNLKLILYITDL